MRRFVVSSAVSVLLAASVGGAAPRAAATTSWTFSGPEGGRVANIAVAASHPATIYVTLDDESGHPLVSKSTDSGATWSDAGTGIGAASFELEAVVVDPTDEDRAYLAAFDTVYRTTNGGGLWTMPSTDLSGQFVLDLVINPDDPDILYAATATSGVWKTTNGGDDWHQKDSGLPAHSNVQDLAISASNPAVVYAGTLDAVYKTNDGAASWTKKNSGISGSTRALAVDPDHSQTAYAGTDSGVYLTTDGGSSWSKSNSGIPSGKRNVYSLLVDPDHTNRVYAGTLPGGLYASTDGADTWEARNTGLTYKGPLALALNPNSTGVLYAGTQGGLFKSTDHGNDWDGSSTGMERTHTNVLAVNPGDADEVFQAVEGGGFLKSTNGGDSWSVHNSTIGSGGVRLRTVAENPNNHSILYVGGLMGDTNIAKSTDKGSTWDLQDSATLFNPEHIEISRPTRASSGPGTPSRGCGGPRTAARTGRNGRTA